MVHQLLRVKKRSDNAQHSVLESDDSNNLYVNIAAATPIDLDTVAEVSMSKTYGQDYNGGLDWNPLDIDEGGHAAVTNHLTNPSGDLIPARGSIIGYTLTKEVQSSVQYLDSTIYGPWPDSAAQYTGYEHIWTVPTGDVQAKYWVYCANPSMDTALNMSIRNGVEMFGSQLYGQIQNIVVPAASYSLFSATAWSSCFTSIGGVLVDESTDLNDANPANDVPFEFTAANDAIYFGHTAPFQRMRITIGTAGNYSASGVWEYWNGSAWTAVPDVYDDTNATVHDGTKSFTRTGSRYIQWQIPADWTAYDIAGNPTSQYWVRWRITDYTSRTTGPALNQGYYKPVGKANVHGYLIEGLYNGNDIKITLENATAVPAGAGFQAEVVVKRL